MQQCQTADQIIRPQDYRCCRSMQCHHGQCCFCEVVDIVRCTRSSDDGADRCFIICKRDNVLSGKELGQSILLLGSKRFQQQTIEVCVAAILRTYTSFAVGIADDLYDIVFGTAIYGALWTGQFKLQESR